MVDAAVTALLLIVAAIHLIPITGFAGAGRLSTLYGIDVGAPDLEVLMRHRAALFGILGAFLMYAAFVPELQPLAFIGAAASMGSFFYLAASVRGWGPAIRKIVVGDVVALVALVGAVALRALAYAG